MSISIRTFSATLCPRCRETRSSDQRHRGKRRQHRAPGGKSPTKLDPTIEGLVKQGETVSFLVVKNDNADISSLMHTLVFGLRGVGAYAYHAALLGKEDDTVYNFIRGAFRGYRE